ncbi:sensor histidine kinase [Sulfitobacter sp. D35]|uniref:sensor histidine kinase n=1 Tax=Sulfitobacter sp. D35 TaxID=3083252 RepID=UPI00296EB465|nr:sensor histidine kinase [Sulfitobacter sp. D35]MDW4498469.1 sensor histidine kinase [Sulfitobacter sp. D35]
MLPIGVNKLAARFRFVEKSLVTDTEMKTETGWPVERFVQAIDLPSLFQPRIGVLQAQIVIGLACCVLAILTREAVDLALPGAGPFALTMPFVLFATLFARWQAGAVALVLLALFAWYYVLPAQGSFQFENASDGPRVVANVLAGAAVVALGEYFRRVVRKTLAQRDRIADERLLLLQELDHRVKNNFAIVGSMMRMEMRGSESKEVQDALSKISGRVDSIARAHGDLYRDANAVGKVQMRLYLDSLCRSIGEGFFTDRDIRIETLVDPVSCNRDTAISIGLIVNELCTNASKHAFQGRTRGRLTVELKTVPEGLLIAVEDDGIGVQGARTSDSRYGSLMVNAFANGLGGELRHVPTARGARFEVIATSS